MKKRLGPTDILFPVPAALVAAGTVKKPSVVTIAWIGMMASNPPVLAVSVKKSRHSLSIIKAQQEFTVNIPSANHFVETDFCGIVSGRTHDKLRECGFTATPSSVVGAPIIEQCPFNLECKVVQDIQFGDWTVIFGEIVETHVDTDALDPETGKISISKLDPLVYCATIREYHKLGERLGFAFDAGKTLITKVK